MMDSNRKHILHPVKSLCKRMGHIAERVAEAEDIFERKHRLIHENIESIYQKLKKIKRCKWSWSKCEQMKFKCYRIKLNNILVRNGQKGKNLKINWQLWLKRDASHYVNTSFTRVSKGFSKFVFLKTLSSWTCHTSMIEFSASASLAMNRLIKSRALSKADFIHKFHSKSKWNDSSAKTSNHDFSLCCKTRWEKWSESCSTRKRKEWKAPKWYLVYSNDSFRVLIHHFRP